MVQIAHQTIAANNPCQDHVLALRLESRAILAVADGAGGRSGGEEASKKTIQFIKDRAAALQTQNDCKNLLLELDQIIAKDKVAGETTAVVCVVGTNGIVGASTGDSGAWMIETLSIDDLTKNQIRKPFLGTGVAQIVGFVRERLVGTLLIATDGLLKYTSRAEIASVARSETFDSVAEKLVSLVRYQSGTFPDDVGIVLYRSD